MASVRSILYVSIAVVALGACAEGSAGDDEGGADAKADSPPDASTLGMPDASTQPVPDANTQPPPDAMPGTPDATPAPDAAPPADAGPQTNVCVEAQPYPVNDLCSAVYDLTTDAAMTGGVQVWGDTTDYVNDLEPNSSCTSGFGLDGPDAMYQVDLTTGQQLNVTLVTDAASAFDAGMYLLPTCADATTCLIGTDSVAGTGTETLQYTAPNDGSYFLIVDSYLSTEMGCYSLTVEIL